LFYSRNEELVPVSCDDPHARPVPPVFPSVSRSFTVNEATPRPGWPFPDASLCSPFKEIPPSFFPDFVFKMTVFPLPEGSYYPFLNQPFLESGSDPVFFSSEKPYSFSPGPTCFKTLMYFYFSPMPISTILARGGLCHACRAFPLIGDPLFLYFFAGDSELYGEFNPEARGSRGWTKSVRLVLLL